MARSSDYSDKTDEATIPPRPQLDGPVVPVLEPNEARQGITHQNVRVVLAVSLGVAVVAMVVVYVAFFGGTAPS